jgi:DNA-binding MarR family transcriptional regulator
MSNAFVSNVGAPTLLADRPANERPANERPANERPANERPANDRRPRDGHQPVDLVLEAITFLCSESRRATQQAARAHGLTGPQITAVKLLDGCELSLSELGARMNATSSTVTGLVDRLETANLVRRERSGYDRRVVHLRLTAAGSELAKRAPVPPREMLERALGALGDDDQQTLCTLLERVSERVREDVGRAPTTPRRASMHGARALRTTIDAVGSTEPHEER